MGSRGSRGHQPTPLNSGPLAARGSLGRRVFKGRPLCGPHNADSTALALSFWEQIILGSLTQAVVGSEEGAQARPECVCLSASQPALAKPEALLSLLS